jgi:homoserine kinase type II
VDVYLLWHTHEFDNGDSDDKLIGVYSTEESANAAIERSKDLPGFRDIPDGFKIVCYQVDEDNWTEGFVTV